MSTLDALIGRVSPRILADPAPDDTQIEKMVAAAVAAPDHGRLRPWQFIVLRGEARQRFGAVLAEALRRREPDAPQSLLDKERDKPLRAPLIIVAAAKPQESRKIPAIEQIVAVGAAAQNLLLAAHALGFGGMWRTGAPAYDASVKRALGLDEQDTIVGFLYLGTPVGDAPPPRRMEPRLAITEWTAPLAP